MQDEVYEIIEVYYDQNGDIKLWTKNTVKPFGENKAELAADIELMLAAQLLPTLKEVLNGSKLIELDF